MTVIRTSAARLTQRTNLDTPIQCPFGSVTHPQPHWFLPRAERQERGPGATSYGLSRWLPGSSDRGADVDKHGAEKTVMRASDDQPVSGSREQEIAVERLNIGSGREGRGRGALPVQPNLGYR
jgi:hypothetical protein